MKTLIIVGGILAIGWIFVEIFLPRIIKKKRTRHNPDNPFIVRDIDFESFIAYFMPDDWAEYLKLENDDTKKTTKKLIEKKRELEKKLFENYPTYYEQIDKRFIKNYFN